MERRTWDTPVRESWNAIICHMLRAVDNHNRIYFLTGDDWHLAKAGQIREYVAELKDWIKDQEG
jgi:predicted NAD/FAD-binding protein